MKLTMKMPIELIIKWNMIGRTYINLNTEPIINSKKCVIISLSRLGYTCKAQRLFPHKCIVTFFRPQPLKVYCVYDDKFEINMPMGRNKK